MKRNEYGSRNVMVVVNGIATGMYKTVCAWVYNKLDGIEEMRQVG